MIIYFLMFIIIPTLLDHSAAIFGKILKQTFILFSSWVNEATVYHKGTKLFQMSDFQKNLIIFVLKFKVFV